VLVRFTQGELSVGQANRRHLEYDCSFGQILEYNGRTKDDDPVAALERNVNGDAMVDRFVQFANEFKLAHTQTIERDFLQGLELSALKLDRDRLRFGENSLEEKKVIKMGFETLHY